MSLWDKEEELLKRFGWELECKSPFEIRHEDGSFATANAARIVLQTCEEEVAEEDEDQKEIDVAVRFMRKNLDWHNHDGWKYQARLIIKAYLEQLDNDE